MKSKVISSEEIIKLINLYNSGLSLSKISTQSNHSTSFLRKIFKDQNFKLRSISKSKQQLKVNDLYFSDINSEEKAYFLGLLFADGNVHSKYNAITLKLQSKDKYILEKFSNIIYDKIHLYQSENNGVLKFSSQQIKQDLIKLGCTPNKSLKLKFPIIRDDLVNHFMRGYFDGDGCITKYKNDYIFSIVATEDFCQTFNKILLDKINVFCSLSKENKSIERGNSITTILKTGGNIKIEKILDFIYKNATVYLPRKYQKYIELKRR